MNICQILNANGREPRNCLRVNESLESGASISEASLWVNTFQLAQLLVFAYVDVFGSTCIC